MRRAKEDEDRDRSLLPIVVPYLSLRQLLTAGGGETHPKMGRDSDQRTGEVARRKSDAGSRPGGQKKRPRKAEKQPLLGALSFSAELVPPPRATVRQGALETIDTERGPRHNTRQNY